MRGIPAVIAAGILLSGCAMGVQHDYQQHALDLGPATTATVAVGTLDQRAYVVNGQKAPAFVGLSRGGFGNPFDVMTRSGRPLASDMSAAIADSMKATGVDARVVELKPGLAAQAAASALAGAGTQRSVLLLVQEWRSDAMVNTGFRYDVQLQVLDPAGQALATRHEQGNENLGGADPFSPGGGNQVIPRYRRMLELMFQDAEVTKALRP